ncbi:alpha-2-macroglobulin family protein [Epilithonimonas vandammei]|uniref:alpha-2-macroglobulin family protein n=1 Tax=Epilithonimonas vandammei TaxID=2487072 RepID=UPI0028ADF60C|nr:MG2 domain-containing protein [Epilithonimonas vandammei]
MKILKSLLVFLLIFATMNFSAQNYYDQQWKKIEDNYKKGTYKSNLPIILEIQNQALKDNNAIQIIKSLKAEFSITKQTYDDTKNDENSKFFAKLQSTGTKLKGDEKQLFHLLTLEFIKDYYQNNSWKINQKTNIDNADLSQIETWSKLDFKNYLLKNYSELEKENSVLKKISMQKYKEIFDESENLDYFPTLSDWYNYNYIEFLRNQNLFTPNELKVNSIKINSIFDSEIASLSGNSQLYFKHQKINYNCELNNCKDKFVQLEKLVEDESAKGDYKVLIIDDMIEILQQKEDYKLALIWANDAKELYPKSKFLNNITNKENQIKNPQLYIFYENETQPNKPIHVVAEGKNVQQFSLNIYEVKDDTQGFLNYVFDSYKTPFAKVKKTLIRKDQFTLPESFDFKTHKTSLELKALPAGIYLAEYVVENSVKSNFYFIVSDSKIIFSKKDALRPFDKLKTGLAQDDNSGGNILKLVNNENGKAFTNENLEITEYVRGKPIVKHSLKTDAFGNFQIPNSANKEYYRNFLVKNGSNYSMINVYGYDYGNRNKAEDKESAQIFLDRKIYRPGQIVYFKVIATGINGETQKVKTLEKVPLNITLNDATGEELQTLKLTTNEFGSVNGSFTLPKNKLNGNFNIEVDNDDDDSDYIISGYTDFNVEEYKRPKFEVTFDPIKDEYKYGQTIELKGKATMFSGVPLSNSTVNYEIKKQNIRWRYFWWYPRGNDNENSVLGDVKTNEKGEFTIKIELKKDETLEGIQIDNYAINASVTDINGETQSANTNVKVASVSHYITANDASTGLSVTDYFSDEAIKLNVDTKNYNDQVLKKSYNVKLEKLEEPKQIFRENFASAVQDLPQLSKAEFVQKFPHDRFDKNDDLKNWKVEKIFLDKVQDTSTPLSVTKNLSTDNQQPTTNLDLGKLQAGTYKILLYNIEGKDTIKTEQFFKVWDKKSLGQNQNPFLEVIKPTQDFKRGEKAKVFVYSAIPDALVNIFIQNGKGETVTETKSLKNGVLEYETVIPKDESISRVNLQFQLVAFNDIKTESVDLKIADSKDDLKIETVTFRDKLQPGQKEKWTIKISGADKENSSTKLRVTAEVLANMYDKSLDQFASNSWNWKGFYSPFYQSSYELRNGLEQQYYNKRFEFLKNYNINSPQFNWFDGGIYGQTSIRIRGLASNKVYTENAVMDMALPAAKAYAKSDTINKKEIEEVVVVGYSTQKKQENLEKIPVRQNLNETAFFYPNLLTDKDGNVSFEFTSPEALTQWKVMFLAHTKDARSAILEKSVVTQKEFSITPNYPRFLREGDELNLQTKISSLVNQKLTGVAQLQILDAFTNEDISEKFGISQLTAVSGYNKEQSFSLAELGNTSSTWKLKVPNNVSSIIIKIVAKGEPLNPLKGTSFSDGEQQAIAVLPNRMLVTDALPIFVKEGQTKTFTLENLKNSNSKTLTNVSNTLELTTNPIWEIMFALPSLKDDTNNSADVIFNKWFADVLASEIFKANPKMKTVFDEYQSKGLLTSNLEKNQELKQLLLDETPWVLESKNETEQMAKISLLFNSNMMRNSINDDWSELVKLQNPDGGFSWYQGYPSSYYTSLYILKNLGRINEWLKGNVSDYQSSEQKEMVKKLVSYVDNEVNKYYDTSTPLSVTKKDNVWNNFVLDYLDTRHYWEKEYALKAKGATLKTSIISKAKTAKITDFTFFGLHRSALLFNNYGLKDVSKKLMTYLKETSTESETQGVYWKQNLNDWGWYSSKTVNHAGAIEAFQKLTPTDENFIEEMKIWLITQKEVNSWGNSRGTAEVIFTILNSGKSWTSNESDKAEITWGGKQLNPQTQATGYVKQTVTSDNLDKNLSTVTIKKESAGIVQGGLFWQYYEDLDKIKSSESYISISKELYKKVKTENGEQLMKINENSPIKVGDKVTVRMILNTDRNMEFIHLKDMRAAGFEPLDVISGYQWKNNLGYYQSTKDASTNFYIEYMPKGKYVFEYDYVANASGKFANGIITLQNYYAPQMNAHTQGTNVVISD